MSYCVTAIFVWRYISCAIFLSGESHEVGSRLDVAQFAPYRRTNSQLNGSQAREGASSSYGKYADTWTPRASAADPRKKTGYTAHPNMFLSQLLMLCLVANQISLTFRSSYGVVWSLCEQGLSIVRMPYGIWTFVAIGPG